MKDGQRVFNSAKGRGRIYNAISTFPESEKLASIASEIAKLAQDHDQSLPDFTPTHLLLLYYATKSGIGWHADGGANDGDNDHPIVSVSLGNSSVFGIKLNGSVEKILLESGDCIIWGGPQRMLVHSILEVKERTCPDFLKLGNVRLNFTFRDAPNVLGHEEGFKYFYGGQTHAKQGESRKPEPK